MELIAQAAGAREALEIFRQHRPDVTLMDLRMPDMNGIQAVTGLNSPLPASSC
jgi:YesN/AraC family two-component response regulator